MVNKKLFIVCIASFFMLVGTLMAAGPWIEEIDEEDTLCIPVGMLSIGAPDGVEQEKASVDFPHSRHMTYSCDTCHHTWQYHAILDTCTASGCHDLTTPPENAIKNGQYTEEGIRYYKYAYHVKCRDCHREINAQNRAKFKTTNISGDVEPMRSGPVGCVECHPNE
jgi:hypothetical protein